MKCRVVYILGSGHCGSTLLDRLLNAHPEIMGLGEVERLGGTLRGVKPGGSVLQQPVWRRTRRYWEKSMGIPFERIEVAAARWRELRSWPPNRKADFQRHNLTLFEGLARASGARVLSDSSTTWQRLALLLEVQPLDLAVIHLVRDGRAVVNSYLRKYGRFGVGFRRWASPSLSAFGLRRKVRNGNWMRLEYEALATAPEATLRRVCRFLGLPFREEMLRFRAAAYAGIGGNRMRFSNDEIRLDRRWIAELSTAHRLLFAGLGGWLNALYGYPVWRRESRARAHLPAAETETVVGDGRAPGGVCFLSGTSYDTELGDSLEKKFDALAKLGDIHVIGFSSAGPSRRFQRRAASFHLLRRFKSPLCRYAAMAVGGTLLTFKLIMRRRIEVVIAQSPYEGAAGACAKIAARWFGRKASLVVESHGDFEEALFLQRRPRAPQLHRAVMRVAARMAFRNADALRSISGFTSGRLRRWNSRSPLVQFPTWTDIEAFRTAREASAQRSQSILYVGVLTPLKGVHFLLEAFAEVCRNFPAWRLWIVGPEQDAEYAGRLRALVQRLGLSDRVEFLGPMSQPDVALRMTRSRLLVLPSQSEGLGRVVIEAMACGLAVVASRVGGIPELVRDGENGLLFEPGDVKALSAILARLLADPREISRLSTQAGRDADRLFSTEAYLEGYRKLLDSCRGIDPGLEGSGGNRRLTFLG